MDSETSRHTTTQQSKTNLLNLHLAEYQALSTRCTYWITLQYAALTVILISLTLAATLWTSPIDRRVFFWGSALFLQIVGYLWMQTQGEQYTAILYVERVLRPAVLKVVEDSQFWCYEPFLATIRKPRRFDPLVSPDFWEFPIAVFATIMIVAILASGILTSQSKVLVGFGGWLGFILNLLFLVVQWLKTVEVRKIRLAFSTSALSSGCDVENIKFP